LKGMLFPGAWHVLLQIVLRAGVMYRRAINEFGEEHGFSRAVKEPIEDAGIGL
jgi:hypothetical protein